MESLGFRVPGRNPKPEKKKKIVEFRAEGVGFGVWGLGYGAPPGLLVVKGCSAGTASGYGLEGSLGFGSVVLVGLGSWECRRDLGSLG